MECEGSARYGAVSLCVSYDVGCFRRRPLKLHARPALGDMGLGVPFNMAQYAALVHMIAQVSGLRVGLLRMLSIMPMCIKPRGRYEDTAGPSAEGLRRLS